MRFLVSWPEAIQSTKVRKTKKRLSVQVCRDLGIHLSPTIARNLEAPKKYLLHLEGDGNPHCVGIEYINDNSMIVYDLNLTFSMTASVFVAALHSATDESTAILFEIGCEASVKMEKFLD